MTTFLHRGATAEHGCNRHLTISHEIFCLIFPLRFGPKQVHDQALNNKPMIKNWDQTGAKGAMQRS